MEWWRDPLAAAWALVIVDLLVAGGTIAAVWVAVRTSRHARREAQEERGRRAVAEARARDLQDEARIRALADRQASLVRFFVKAVAEVDDGAVATVKIKNRTGEDLLDVVVRYTDPDGRSRTQRVGKVPPFRTTMRLHTVTLPISRDVPARELDVVVEFTDDWLDRWRVHRDTTLELIQPRPVRGD